MPTLYMNGRFLPESRAAVPVTDRALSWGLGLFESMRAYNGRAFRLKDRIARLRRSARHFKIVRRIPDLARAIPELLRKNRMKNGYLRITLTDGGNLFVVARRWPMPDAKLYRRGGALRTAPWRRDARAPLYGHKTINYWENMLARWDAHRRGSLDTLFLGLDGEVLEGSGSNIFLIQRGRLITPSLASRVLPGVTRKIVLECARRIGLPIEERTVKFAQLLRAREVFMTNSLIEVMPVAKIDGKPIGKPGPVTKDLAEAYRALVKKECSPTT